MRWKIKMKKKNKKKRKKKKKEKNLRIVHIRNHISTEYQNSIRSLWWLSNAYTEGETC